MPRFTSFRNCLSRGDGRVNPRMGFDPGSAQTAYGPGARMDLAKSTVNRCCCPAGKRVAPF